MDIGSGKSYPSNALSNFAPHPFEMDGIVCNSMEGAKETALTKNEFCSRLTKLRDFGTLKEIENKKLL